MFLFHFLFFIEYEENKKVSKKAAVSLPLPFCAASNNMELKMEPRNFPRKMQHVDHMIPAMAYVPMQRFEQIYDLSTALKNGTLFPELCKPFCGKGGGECL